MSEAGRLVKVHVKFGDVEQTFEGNIEDVWVGVNKLFGEFVPSFDVAKKLVLNVDLQRLANDCEGVIGFSKEGVNLLVSKEKLTDNETLLLWFLAYDLGFSLGLVESCAVSRKELQTKLGKSGKIASTRLGELTKLDMIARTGDDKYKITTFGVVQMQKEILPKVKAKIG